MHWIEKQIRKMDEKIETNQVKVITLITYEDLTRNGSCTKHDFYEAQNINNKNNMLSITRNKMKDVLSIAYDMVQNL